jgi:DNA-directed RNA polymerase specialized sigma24 family protein
MSFLNPIPVAVRRSLDRRQPAGQTRTSGYFLELVHRHHHPAFQIAHGILRDEVAAEKITREVFTRVRRRIERGANQTAAVLWIYHACLRFSRRYYWRAAPVRMRRRLDETCRCSQREFTLPEFVHTLAFQPERIGRHDCELIALRHVLGLSLDQIGQLLRMHPYEISNRLTWSLERLKETKLPVFAEAPADELLQAVSA